MSFHGEVLARRIIADFRVLGLAEKGQIRNVVHIDPEVGPSSNYAVFAIRGPARVRDLWTHADLGTFNGRFSATAPAHGVVMVRIRPPVGG